MYRHDTLNIPFSRKTRVSWYQNVSILDFTGANVDEGGSDKMELLRQGCPTYGPRARIRPAGHFHPAREAYEAY